jgi:hypothetical protein
MPWHQGTLLVVAFFELGFCWCILNARFGDFIEQSSVPWRAEEVRNQKSEFKTFDNATKLF